MNAGLSDSNYGIPTFSFSNSKFSEVAIVPRKIGFLLDDRTILNKFNLANIDNLESNRIVNDVIDSCKKIK